MSKYLKNFIEELSVRKENVQNDEAEEMQENKENIEILKGLLQQSVLLAQRVEKEAKHS